MIPATAAEVASSGVPTLPLVRAARPVLAELARDLADAGLGVVLTDAHGRVLERIADPLGTGVDVALGAAPVSEPGSGRILGRVGLVAVGNGTSALMAPFARNAARDIERRLVPTAAPAWDLLSQTERDVAGLVARGLTNVQVGQRLFMSRHTVGSHLRRIYRKLSVTSRVGLARVVAELPAA